MTPPSYTEYVLQSLQEEEREVLRAHRERRRREAAWAEYRAMRRDLPA